MYMSGRNKDQFRAGIVDGSPAMQSHPLDTCVQYLVEEQAERTPEALAVVAGSQSLSYAALNQRANQLAHLLRGLGIQPEVPVGLCVDRSLELVVGMLGILKAGGAYVPLDPQYPADRLSFLLADALVPVLLTQSHLRDRLPAVSTHVIALDEEPRLSMQSTANPCPLATPDHLAYIIYTSGSTGTPKGVQITHKSLLNLVGWHQQAFALTARDRTTQIASPAFDATGWEVWPSLCCGASVYLVDEQIRTLPPALRDWLVRHQITISFLPTPLAEQMLDLDWPPETALRVLLTGADVLHRYPAATLPFALINNYGPTEATVVATSGRIWLQAEAEMPPSIGCPIANTEVYLLDEHLQQVAMDEPGELHIGGIGLARGYLNRPELTREKFIPHPFSPDPDARLYKTGDLARFLPDGQLAFLGRIDHQIKLRGYRIEPDEIIVALNRYPAVQASYVLAREDAPGQKQLVAYLVVQPDLTVELADLVQTLQATLPDYMVPALFVQIDALPLTPNGKVDRDALPAPTPANMLGAETFAAPQTPIEDKLATTVAALLQIERVGVTENFFLLGGHSMLGAQLIAWIQATFGLSLPLRTLFDAPTVRQLAAEVEGRLVAKLEAMSEDEACRLLER